MYFMQSFLTILTGFALLAEAASISHSNIVDLGYARHRPTYTNTTRSGQNVLSYMNIRFAQSPTGPLRFKKPAVPPHYSEGIQDGLFPPRYTDCISAAPSVVPFPDINGTAWGHEDCLFLNVIVPEGVKPGDNVPVLHWITGSGYAFAGKDSFYGPLGLIDGIKDNPEEKFIFVASNYRLGMPGWTALPNSDMDPNVGLHDAVAAVEWTHKYISLFGGDPNQITVMGESAGGAIINLMLTGSGGRGKLPFQQAFISSPAMPPRRNATSRRTKLYEDVLAATNCTSVECLRSISESDLLAANYHLVAEVYSNGGGGDFGPGIGFGPVTDGDYVPDVPAILFDQGRYHKSMRSLIVGTMAEEGMTTSSDQNMPQAFPELVRRILPTASNSTIASIQAHFPYPADLPAKLAWDWTTAMVFECNVYNVAKAFEEKTRRYIMSIPPAIHGQDVPYMFYTNDASTPVANSTTALQYQSYIRQFVAGNRRSQPVVPHRATTLAPDWPVYGKDSLFFNITSDGFIDEAMPQNRESTCQFLNQIVADPANGA
ncbi:hypothetical protein O988_01556 [Pseudogymnoascus sp. VKM F-3808]|nr:hypothetical protein O988_01556 [Pseudogymnoascus sp. VKM F-3808]